MQGPTYQQFEFCVGTPDAGHHPAPGFLVDYVGHAAMIGRMQQLSGE
jgi:hypothetical protein